MNHKLHNTILASAVVGAMLLFGLLIAEPAGGDGHPAQSHEPLHGRTAGSVIAAELRNDLARDMERRARRLEADLASAGSASEALAMASTLLATSMVEATVASVIEDVVHRQASMARAPAGDDASDERPARRRSAMAMPYFSTARGSRRGYGE